MRRRQRRLRSWLRHERMTVAMALAERTHHTAPRGLKMARAGDEPTNQQTRKPKNQKTNKPKNQKTNDQQTNDQRPTTTTNDHQRPQQQPQPTTTHHNTQQPTTTQGGLWKTAGPGRLRTKLYGDRSPKQPGKRCSSSYLTKTPHGCGPRFLPSLCRRNESSGTPWSTLSTSSAVRPWCRSSTFLCRRWWNSCKTCSSSSTNSRPFPSREVPKIFTEDVLMRAVLRDTQLVEQLVEVPTIVSYSSLLLLQTIVEQNVAFQLLVVVELVKVFPGFLPGQHYSVTAEQIVDNPVPSPGGAGCLQGLHRGQSSKAFSEQIAEFPDPGRSSRFSTTSHHRNIKCEDPAHPGVGTGCAVELMDPMSSAGVWCRWLRH